MQCKEILVRPTNLDIDILWYQKSMYNSIQVDQVINFSWYFIIRLNYFAKPYKIRFFKLLLVVFYKLSVTLCILFLLIITISRVICLSWLEKNLSLDFFFYGNPQNLSNDKINRKHIHYWMVQIQLSVSVI